MTQEVFSSTEVTSAASEVNIYCATCKYLFLFDYTDAAKQLDLQIFCKTVQKIQRVRTISRKFYATHGADLSETRTAIRFICMFTHVADRFQRFTISESNLIFTKSRKRATHQSTWHVARASRN